MLSGPGVKEGFPVWRVLIVEDDPQMRDFFAASVLRSDQLTLLASVGTVAEACAWLDDPAHGVEVLLTDLGLPDGSGLEVIRYARLRHPECEPLVISMFGDEDNVLTSIEAGALGYIHKDAAPDDIAHTIVEMKKGASPISPMIARRVLSKYRILQSNQPKALLNRAEPATKAVATSGEKNLLSGREQEVLELIARGFSYAEIARLKAVTVHTVQTHIKNLYSKLAVHSKSEAVFEATRMGLLPPHG
ncbi:MAG: DNA-binding response regulator [Polaromonas sp. 39-63-203]|jgi:DNA-binding NarL/FixJ family response regulator|uniref:response regulator transcription factor n=1 Tax=Polaromonas sp. TaxID=1869339 RepID=UPI000BCDA0D7|nr:response regulator transcription factor [Polaromonas sp.]OYY51958.1 MAG: DNA-binding response regulator [Polaromonas sp. 35-63-240]OYZ83459.1 MAG: DNA-binding response regulator [Polaromonas sp. 24-62-144]OZA97006.1 MAG: DNA-binding response regulator [Polaromonas sp. 39-63-203]HQS31245.1 response regulator transcription factor [Polaromonas sp.]HQS90427.1 response regulator transcription factor [Polaromonas sp.]